MTLDDVIIREYRDGDEEQINALHNEAWGKQRSRAEWAWQFRDSPAGPAVYVVAEHHGRIVGTQAVMPIAFFYRGKEILSGKSEDTLLSPEYRGRGIFGRLYEKAFDLCIHRGIPFIWGVGNLVPLFERTGFQFVASTNQMLLTLAPLGTYRCLVSVADSKRSPKGPAALLFRAGLLGLSGLSYLMGRIASAVHRRPCESGLEVVSLSEQHPGIGDFWQEFSRDRSFLTVIRSREYLRWRLFNNPIVKYTCLGVVRGEKICGYIVLSRGLQRDVGYITDFCVLDEDFDTTSSLLINAAVRHFNSAGVPAILGWSVSRNAEEMKHTAALRRRGFIKLGYGGGKFVAKVLEPETIAPEDAADRDNWFFSRILTQGVEG